MKHHILSILLAIAVLCCGCKATAPLPDSSDIPPAISSTDSEWRGVWVSYLDLDPLLQGADAATAMARLDAMLDTCRNSGMNTVFFHVRAYSDAYYPSAIFPPAASAAPLLEAGFDPLAYATEAAHARGLALHAWINPYRIGKDKNNAVCDAVFEWDGGWYYNPADPAARTAVIQGVREILTQYAVDGIHFDDYFYPTNMPAEAAAFETIPTGMTVSDWRRTQIDSLISAVHGLTGFHKRLFGISPTALPQSNRDRAYADTAMWLATEGYVDYLCPQLYYGFAHETNPFDEMLSLWTAMPQHPTVSLYIGLALYKSGTTDAYAGSGRDEWQTHHDIISRQITALRACDTVSGFVLFRYIHLADADEEMTYLQKIL